MSSNIDRKSNRKDPEELQEWVKMGTPNMDARLHAQHRLDRQMRLLGLICLLRMSGVIQKGAIVSLGETTLQHGVGGPGMQAAHKLLLTVFIGGKELSGIVQDSALKMFLIFLHAETSVIDRYYNEADSEIENNGGRDGMLAIIKAIVNKDFNGPHSGDFRTCLLESWEKLKKLYVSECNKSIGTCEEMFKKEDKNYKARLALVEKKVNIPQKQIEDALRRYQAAEKKVNVLKEYLAIATNMGFPLLKPELDNMFDLVFTQWNKENQTGKKCAVCGAPTTLTCGRCRGIYYCSRDHQRSDWPQHRKVCKVA
jgi:MYND finger